MSDTTREKILDAALSLFAVGGYDGTSLAHIARAVGIQKPSLYNHFSGKDELFLTVAEKVMKELNAEMADSANKHREKAIQERIYYVLMDSTNFIYQKHEGMMYKRLMVFPPEALLEETRTLTKTGDAGIDQILMDFYEQGREEGTLNNDSFSVFKAAFYCLMDGLFTESFIYREDEFKERFEGAWHVFWRGVKK